MMYEKKNTFYRKKLASHTILTIHSIDTRSSFAILNIVLKLHLHLHYMILLAADDCDMRSHRSRNYNIIVTASRIVNFHLFCICRLHMQK